MFCSSLSPFRLCVRRHSIVGLGLCICGIVVVVCVGWKGVWCVVCGVLHIIRVVACISAVCVMAVRDDSACLVLSHCVVGCGMAVCDGGVRVCGLVACFSLLLLRVGVRGSARAALRARTLSPNTTASLFLLASPSLPLPAFLLLSSFLVFGMAVCVFTMYHCVVLA